MVDGEFLILGGGVSGLAAGWVLGDRAIVLEREDRPGGLVRSECVESYWFDRVLHLLHLSHPSVEARLKVLLGSDLALCPREAWVECAAGIARYPIQSHLGTLDREWVIRCLEDFAREYHSSDSVVAESYPEMLIRTFGEALCELFFFPYNRKIWKRPLESLSHSGVEWNIVRPDFAEALRGAVAPEMRAKAYNDNGWYPRPQADSPLRGMEVLSARMAEQVPGLMLEHEVIELNPGQRRARVRHGGVELHLSYSSTCISTLPLPVTLDICRNTPSDLRDEVRCLKRNRVRSVMVCVRGDRPLGTGHWRYYSDESIVFTRLVFMTQFDPLSAPDDGFGVLAEITEPAEESMVSDEDLSARVIEDLYKVGVLTPVCEAVATRVLAVDPAYVVFTRESRTTVRRALDFLRASGVEPLGRYGRWEYSSMEQVIRDGFELAERLADSSAGGEEA